MPNLVGTGSSQAPTNGMLGPLAYQASNNVVIGSMEPGNISKFKAELYGSGTRSVFVYNLSLIHI